MKKQLLAIIIAAGVSGCAMTPEQRANFINGMNAINMGFQQRHYQQSPVDVFIESQRAFRQQRAQYQPPQQMHCTSQSRFGTTYTDCR